MVMVSGLPKMGTYLSIFITALTSVLWVTLVMQPKGWALRITPIYTVDTGAWQVSISRGAVANLLTGGTKNRRAVAFFEAFSPAVRTTEDFKEYLCGISELSRILMSDICLIGTNLYISSMVLIGCVFFGTFLNWCACGMLAMWAFMKQRESSRLLARVLYFLTFAFYVGGVSQYAAAANGLKDLPPTFPEEMGFDHPQVSFGRNVFGGITLCILQLIPLFIVFVFVGRTKEEAINEHQSHKKKEAREETRLANREYMDQVGYGAAGSGYDASYDQYGWDPSFQGQPGMQMAYQQGEMAYGVAGVPMGTPLPYADPNAAAGVPMGTPLPYADPNAAVMATPQGDPTAQSFQSS